MSKECSIDIVSIYILEIKSTFALFLSRKYAIGFEWADISLQCDVHIHQASISLCFVYILIY